MKTKLTRMIAMMLAVLMLISCAACGNDTPGSTDNESVTTAPTTESAQGSTEPEKLPSAPDATNPSEPTIEGTEPSEPATTPTEPEVPVTQPTEPEAPVTKPTEPETPIQPDPPAPVVKNEYFNDTNYEMEEGKIAVRPRHVYWKDGKLVAECFVINGESYITQNICVTNLAVETPDGKVIAKSYFDYTHEEEVRYGSWYIQTFTFSEEKVLIKDADLRSLVLKEGTSWNGRSNEYSNPDTYNYPLDRGQLDNDDLTMLEKKVDVRVRWAYWKDGMLNVRLMVANGLDVTATNINVTKLTFTNADGVITSDSFGILQEEDYTPVTIEPGRFVDVDILIGEEGSNNELINAQWDVQFTNGEVQPIDPFNGATDEQILACLEFSPAGRTPMNDNPGYTYMNETHVVGTRIDAALDIADVEVLYATVNGAPCDVYQTWNHGKISEIIDYEEWNAETFGCRELHNIFLVKSDTPIEVTDDRTDYVIVEHTIMFRVYLTNGEHRDVLYEDNNYVLSIFGGGLMTDPECYE